MRLLELSQLKSEQPESGERKEKEGKLGADFPREESSYSSRHGISLRPGVVQVQLRICCEMNLSHRQNKVPDALLVMKE